MRYLTETSTQQIKNLQDLNQEIRQRLSSMPSSTEQEMQSLGQWLEEVEQQVKNLEDLSLIISHHLKILRVKYNEKQKRDSSKV